MKFGRRIFAALNSNFSAAFSAKIAASEYFRRPPARRSRCEAENRLSPYSVAPLRVAKYSRNITLKTMLAGEAPAIRAISRRFALYGTKTSVAARV